MKKLQDANGLSDVELKSGIDCAVKYLLDKQEMDHFLLGSPSYDYKGFLAKLDSTESALKAAVKHLQKLETYFEMGRLDAFDLSAHRIRKATEGAADALTQIQIATNETKLFHVPATRALDLQKSAARLAYALVGDRVRGQARSVTSSILNGAKLNIPPPESSTVTKWLKEFRRENVNVK